MFYLKVHDLPGEVLVAVCDKDLLGKRLCDGDLKLEVSDRFYGGDLVDEGAVFSALEKASIANIIGNVIVGKALERSLISCLGVIEVGGVKHAQIVSLPRSKKP